MVLARRILMPLAAPAIALVAALLITSGIVSMVGASPTDFWTALLDKPSDRGIVNMTNQTALIFVAAVAAAIGFRMNLFNIGVEGQYRMASYVAALFAGAAFFSGWLNIVATIVIAMATGAAWAAIPALLKVTRGVSEVISTIMLNAIATFLVGYLLANYGQRTGDARRTTPVDPDSLVSSWYPFKNDSTGVDTAGPIWMLGLLAVVVGVGYWLMVNWTRFGFNLRATGESESAAVASGVSVKRMIVVSMMLSGAVAGLIWLPQLLADTRSGHYFSEDAFQSGLGFTGIAVALLGRNKAVGMAFGALLFAYLSVQANALEAARVGVSKDIVIVVQGVIVLCVVVAYEVIGRWRTAIEQRAVTAALRAEKQEVSA